jgi:hypothetical protein
MAQKQVKTVEVSQRDRDKIITAWINAGWTLSQISETNRGKFLLIFERFEVPAPTKSRTKKSNKLARNLGCGCISLIACGGIFYVALISANLSNVRNPTRTRELTQIANSAQITALSTPSLATTRTRAGRTTPLASRTSVSISTATPTPTLTTIPVTATSSVREYVVSSSSSVNVRRCPQLICDIVGTLQTGESVFVIDTESGAEVNGSSMWYVVDYDSDDGYIHSSVVSEIGDVNQPQTMPLVLSTPNPQLTEIPTELFSEQDIHDAAYLTDALSIVAGEQNIESVVVVDGRDNGSERAAIITYLSSANTENELAEEIFDILSGTAAGIEAGDIDLDSVALVIGNAFGNAIGIATIDAASLNDLQNGRITRGQLFHRLNITPF